MVDDAVRGRFKGEGLGRLGADASSGSVGSHISKQTVSDVRSCITQWTKSRPTLLRFRLDPLLVLCELILAAIDECRPISRTTTVDLLDFAS